MVFVDTTLAMPVIPFLIVVLIIQGPITWNWALLWLLCALVAMASRNAYLLRPKNQKLPGVTPRGRFFNLFKDFLANFCLVMASVALLNVNINLIGLYDPTMAGWGRVLHSALLVAGGIRFWWWWMAPIACTILLAIGFLLVGIELDEHLQLSKED